VRDYHSTMTDRRDRDAPEHVGRLILVKLCEWAGREQHAPPMTGHGTGAARRESRTRNDVRSQTSRLEEPRIRREDNGAAPFVDFGATWASRGQLT
jgi:hypothetical protein